MVRNYSPDLDARPGTTRRIFEGELVAGVPSHVQLLARVRMRLLNNVSGPDDLRRLGHLRIKRADRGRDPDRYLLQVDSRWQLRFLWIRGGARNVELIEKRWY